MNNVGSENLSFAEADFLSLVKDVKNVLLENISYLPININIIIGIVIIAIGGFLMLFLTSNSAGGDEEEVTVNDNIDDLSENVESKKVESQKKEREEELEKEKLEKERQEREKLEKQQLEIEQQKEKQEQKEQKDQKEALEEKKSYEQKEENKKKQNEVDLEKNKILNLENNLNTKKNMAEKLTEVNGVFQKIVDALNVGKKTTEIVDLFDELIYIGKDKEFFGIVNATQIFFNENTYKERQNLNLKTISNWFEKEAEIIEKTAVHMKDGPKKNEVLEKASNFYMNAAEFQFIQNSTKSVTNFEKSVVLDPYKNEKLAKFGDACILFERYEKVEEISDKLIQNMSSDLSRKNVSFCLSFCDKMFENKIENTALKMKNQIKDILKNHGILIPDQSKYNHQKIISMLQEQQQTKEEET